MDLHLRSDAKAEARALVLEHHYSHRWPSCPRFVVTWHVTGGLFGDRGPAVAAVVLGDPASGWKERVWELQRLVRIEAPLTLTALISAACKESKRLGLIDLLISYADPIAGHHGGIYQAASWHYSGESAHAGGPKAFRIGGQVVHSRAVQHQYGTADRARVAELAGVEVIPIARTAKHLYWRALNRRGKAKAKRLGLKSLPYPKPREAESGSDA